VSHAIGRPPVVWAPRGGSRRHDFGWATPALNGNLALWSDGTDNTAIEIRAGDSIEEYQMPQLRSVTWSPDGATVAAISAPSGDASIGLTLFPAP